MKNREIKFRAWTVLEGKGIFIYFPIYEIGEFDWGVFDVEPVFQQFTGLKDKNSKEIYEGDLVKTDINHELAILRAGGIDVYSKGTITWLREGFEVCQENIGATRLSNFASCYCHPCGLEIIGNIFQNSEL